MAASKSVVLREEEKQQLEKVRRRIVNEVLLCLVCAHHLDLIFSSARLRAAGNKILASLHDNKIVSC